MFKNAIVKIPCRAVTEGITSNPELGKPNYELALEQHMAYIAALEQAGLSVTVLPPDENYPDSCFVEDTAVLTSRCAILSNPGAPSRKGESALMLPTLKQFFPADRIAFIEPPGTLEGGDVMMVGDHFFVGRSARTNGDGIRQFLSILERFGLTGQEVPLEHVLHLKTGVNYLDNGQMLVSGEFVRKLEFSKYQRFEIQEDEAYAANSLWLNGSVLVPAGYPKTKALIRGLGYRVIPVDTSEFRKIDGGLSCLSLRFTSLLPER